MSGEQSVGIVSQLRRIRGLAWIFLTHNFERKEKTSGGRRESGDRNKKTTDATFAEVA